MIVESRIQGGYRAGGKALLRKGLNEIDESTLTSGERLFLKEMIKTRLVKVIAASEPKPVAAPEPIAPPASESKPALPRKRSMLKNGAGAGIAPEASPRGDAEVPEVMKPTVRRTRVRPQDG